MSIIELSKQITEAYDLINERIDLQKKAYDEKGIHYARISYEDVSLEDILDVKLLPLLPELIEKHLYLSRQIRWKSYRVYIASLCEIVKNGLVNGGILKTMEARIGPFDRNHHYDLLKQALQFEGIEVLERHRKYEETIINEAGIPHGYHKKCIEIFRIFWKWMRNFAALERETFLRNFFNEQPLEKNYIVDSNDLYTLQVLRQDTSAFSEKVIKTCLKFSVVFTAIDSCPLTITNENIEGIAREISADVGFDIFTIVKSSSVKQYILDYVKRISFLKFKHLQESLPDNEEIIIPTGRIKKNGDYKFQNYIGGTHLIRGNAYDVSYPISLSIDDIYKLEKCKPVMYGNAVIYTSEDLISVDIDGFDRPCRKFYKSTTGLLYVFYERISPASFVYIDGIPITSNDSFAQKTYISKFWDNEKRHYRLAVCMDTIKYAERSNAMRPVSICCNGLEVYKSATNQNGSFRVSDKLLPIETLPYDNGFKFVFQSGDTIINEWSVDLSDKYLWAKQSGIRIRENIDLTKWFGPSNIIIFSKTIVNDADFVTKYLYDEQDYHVYEGIFDKTRESIFLLGEEIPIVHPTSPYMELMTEYDIISGCYCVREEFPLSISIHQIDQTDKSQILSIEHEGDEKSYNVLNLNVTDLQNATELLPLTNLEDSSVIGKWKFVLYVNGHRINELELVIIPKVEIIPLQTSYLEDHPVLVQISSSSACFEEEGYYTCKKNMEIGKAVLQITGHLVHALPIEFECYIERCNISKHFVFTPFMWGLKLMNIQNGEWISEFPSRLSILELEKSGVFICATSDVDLVISTGSEGFTRLIHPGYNKINIRQLLYDIKARTTVSFKDNYGRIKEINIICPTNYEVVGLDYEDGFMKIRVNYFGPINTVWELRVFCERTLIYSTKKEVYHNKISSMLLIYKSKFHGSNFSIEARTGTQDFQKIYTNIINWDKLNAPSYMQISKNMPLTRLLEQRTFSKETTINSGLISVLELGGYK